MSEIRNLLRPDLVGRTPYGAPQLDVAVALNTNENAYAVPPAVVRDIEAALSELAPRLNRYPDREFTELRKALAAYLNRGVVDLSPDWIWAANGSNEVLLHLVQAFAGPGRRAVGFTPSYSMHPILCATSGTDWIEGHRRSTPGRPFELSADEAVSQVRHIDPHVVFLTSPNNPTGTSLDLDVVDAVYAAAARAIVIIDEAYAEFAREGTRSALTLLANRPRLVVTRTMSKAFAFAGARVGYLAAHPELIDCLRLVRLPYHLSAQTQALALVALGHTTTMLANVDLLRGQRDRMIDGLFAAGLQPVPSDANFVLFGGLRDATSTWRALLDDGVLVRDVGIAHHLRVTAGTPQETAAFLGAISALTEEHYQAASVMEGQL